MEENQKKRGIKALLLLKPDKSPTGRAIWRYTEWELPGLLSGLLAISILWPLSHFYDLNTVAFLIIILAIYFVVHVAVMLYRKRRH